MRILTVLLVVALIFALERYSIEHCFDDLFYTVKPEKTIVECGENFGIRTTIENRGRLPALFIRLREYMPKEIKATEPLGEKTADQTKTDTVIEQTLYLLPGRQAQRNASFHIDTRGRHLTGSARMTCGDLLGIKRETKQCGSPIELIVYPKPLDMKYIEPAFGAYLGAISVRRFIMPDPIQTAGFREYTGYEQQKDISWPQSLKRGTLMVKQYDYTSDQKVSVIADVENGSHQDIEMCYAAARTICEQLENRHIVYSFACDAVMNPGMRPAFIPDGTGNRHMNVVNEALGRGGHAAVISAAKLFRASFGTQTEMRSYFVITVQAEHVTTMIRNYERMLGQKICIIDAHQLVQEVQS